MQFRKKVLIVDDDSDTRQLVRKVLQKLDFIDFLEAESAEESIAIAHMERPDLILMDILLPGIDGYEACRKIKSDPILKSTIVIFMTGLSMDEIDDKIIQVNGDDLLRKPLDVSELYFRIKNYLTLVMIRNNHTDLECHAESMEAYFLCDEGRTINLGQGFLYQAHIKSLCKEHHFIPLMKQEILLLETFIRHKNHIVSYEQLVNAISEKGESSTIGNVRTLVKLLRRKTYPELIQNQHSFGYKLII